MSRYFFHIRDGDERRTDFNGVILPDLEAAVAWALDIARRALSDDALEGAMPMSKRVEVEDQCGIRVHDLPFVDAVEFTFNERYRRGRSTIDFSASARAPMAVAC